MRKIILRILLAIFCAFFVANQALAFTQAENTCIKTNNLIPLQVSIPGCDDKLLKEQTDPNRDFCCNEARTETIAVKDAPNYIAPLMRFGLIASAVLFTALLVIGGLMYMGSQGAPDYINRARKLMKNAATGIVLIIFSTMILYQINPALIALKLTKPEAILSIKCCKVATSTTPAAPPPPVQEIPEYASEAGSVPTTLVPPANTTPPKEEYYFQHTLKGEGGDAKYVCDGSDTVVADYLCFHMEEDYGLDDATIASLPKGTNSTVSINGRSATGQADFMAALLAADAEMKADGKKGLMVAESLRSLERSAQIRKDFGYISDSQNPGVTVPAGYKDLNGKVYNKPTKLAAAAPPGKSIHNKGLAIDTVGDNWKEAQPYLAKHSILNCLSGDKNHFSVGEFKRNPFKGYNVADTCK